MSPEFQRLMKQASQFKGLDSSASLRAATEATAAIQAALAGKLPGGQAGNNAFSGGLWPGAFETRQGNFADVIDVQARELVDKFKRPSNPSPANPADADASPLEPLQPEPTQAGGQFIAGSFADASTRRDYKLYIPPNAAGKPLPLLVMLHGCTQNPDDFAAGTAMNELARSQGFYVLYPEQSKRANPQRCWNWFKHSHQARGRGEPALIAGMTQDIMKRYPVDANRVFVAGLSAGGAMAAIMGSTYPDLYAAVGVHSGLAAGTATDLPSALSAMSGGPAQAGRGSNKPGNIKNAASMPTIVFHGDADATVHPGNGEQVIHATGSAGAAIETETLKSATGRSSTRRVFRETDGKVVAEHWRIHGAPHAWSGGSAKGSYTDPQGPDASAEMMRFFMAHPRDAS